MGVFVTFDKCSIDTFFYYYLILFIICTFESSFIRYIECMMIIAQSKKKTKKMTVTSGEF